MATIIPKEFLPHLKIVIEWHLVAYVPDILLDTSLKRLLERIYKERLNVADFLIAEGELYPIRECVYDALNNVGECEVDEDVIQSIRDWIEIEYKKGKHA